MQVNRFQGFILEHSYLINTTHQCQVGTKKLKSEQNSVGFPQPQNKVVMHQPSHQVTEMAPAVRVALTGRSRVYTTDDFDDSRREASNRASRPRLGAVPTAE